jgi:hypothetical protein
MKIAYMSLLLLIGSMLHGANLIHELDFNNDFTDQIGSATVSVIHANSQSFDNGSWNWTASSTPGAGLLLGTQLPENTRYSLRIVFKYNVINNIWTKIVSMNGLTNLNSGYFTSDYGVYFSGNHIGFYNYYFNGNLTHTANTWYDLIVTRSQSGVMSIYMAILGDEPVRVAQFNDYQNYGVPSRLSTSEGALSYFGLFYDDTATTAEWTTGGSVSLVQVWDDAIAVVAVQNPLISVEGSAIHLNWSTFPGATSYNIYASDSPDTGWILIGNSLTTGFIMNQIHQKQFYQIKAVW